MQKMFVWVLTATLSVLGRVVYAAAATTDEFDAEPYTWLNFNDISETGELTAAVTFENSGSCETHFAPSTGNIVQTGKENYGWQFGAASYTTNIAKSGSSLSPATYLTRMDFAGVGFSSWKVVWGTNGNKFGGYALCVKGNPTDGYQVKVCRHAEGNLREDLVVYDVPGDKAEGLHTYITTCNGSSMRLYLDGVLVKKGWDGGGIQTPDRQNDKFGFGQPSNAGSGMVPTGLILDDFRSYGSVLSPVTIGAAFGLTVAAEPNVRFKFEGSLDNIGTDTASFGGERPEAAHYLNLRSDASANQGFFTIAGKVHPYSSLNAFGSGNEVLIAASLVSVPDANSTLFAVGSGSTPAVLGLFSGGANEVFVGEIASAGNNNLTRLVTATVEGATAALHHYAIAYDKSTHELAFFVDGVLVEDANAATPTVSPGGGLQFGSIFGNSNAGGARRSGGVIFEDFAIYRQIPTAAAEIATIAAEFPPCSLAPILSVRGETNWSTGNWSVSQAPQSGDMIIRADGAATNYVDLAVTPGTITFIPAANVTTMTLAIADGGSMAATKFDVRAPLKLVVKGAGSLPFTGMTGNGEMTLDIGSDSTATIGANNISYTGNLILRRGRFKMGHSNAFGINSNVHTVRVETVSILDFNGKSNFTFPIEFAGGTVANTGAPTVTSMIQFANVIFAGDGTVEAAANLYSIGNQWGSIAYALNGHTLAKTGTGIYGICTGNYTGTGTFDIREGTLMIDAGTIAADADLIFKVADGATLQFATNRYQQASRSLTVNGTIRLGGSGRVLGSAIAGAWTLRPDGSGYLVFGDALPVPENGGALEIAVDLSAIDLAGGQMRQVPLFRVESAEMMPANLAFTGLEALPASWRVVKTLGGLGYKIDKSGFSIIVR